MLSIQSNILVQPHNTTTNSNISVDGLVRAKVVSGGGEGGLIRAGDGGFGGGHEAVIAGDEGNRGGRGFVRAGGRDFEVARGLIRAGGFGGYGLMFKKRIALKQECLCIVYSVHIALTDKFYFNLFTLQKYLNIKRDHTILSKVS